MKFLSIMFGLLLALPSLGLGQQVVDTLITGGKVFRTTEGTFAPNTGIAVKDGRFIKIGVNRNEFQAAF